jgi:pyruvate dehydrogenase kinase 2/3/4
MYVHIFEISRYADTKAAFQSMDATKAAHWDTPTPPPIRATIAEGSNDVSVRISDEGGGIWRPEQPITNPSDLFSFSHVRNAARMEDSRIGALRTVSSSEKGMNATVREQTDSDHRAATSHRPRTGTGLPMSSVFAT